MEVNLNFQGGGKSKILIKFIILEQDTKNKTTKIAGIKVFVDIIK